MPQRDDKVGIHFGRISPECWERLGGQPGMIIEAAVQALVQARDEGRDVTFPATLRSGVTKKLWLKPETVSTLNGISDQTGVRKTPLILAALDLYFRHPSDAIAHPKRHPKEKQ